MRKVFHSLSQVVDSCHKTFLSEGKDVVLFDIDGTLAHMVDRGPYEWEKVGSRAFFYFLPCFTSIPLS